MSSAQALPNNFSDDSNSLRTIVIWIANHNLSWSNWYIPMLMRGCELICILSSTGELPPCSMFLALFCCSRSEQLVAAAAKCLPQLAFLSSSLKDRNVLRAGRWGAGALGCWCAGRWELSQILKTKR
jgi:hypothetical protein